MNDYKIVVLGNGDEWCGVILNDFKKLENAKVINKKVPYNGNKVINKIISKHYSESINKKVKLPLKRIWYKRLANTICENKDEKLIIIIYDRNKVGNDTGFLKYLKKHFINSKLIYVFTNIVNISGAKNNKYINKLNKYYDLVYAFDPEDAPKYNFKYNPLLYSYDNDKINRNIGNSVFYVGKAKDRYEMLIDVFERLEELNIDNKFYIVDVPIDKQKHCDKIVYNKRIHYDECLDNIKKSKCLIDVIQGESSGYTIKVCEAVYYDKLLITTNEEIKKAPFYDPKKILVIKSADDITKSFFDNNDVKYSKKDRDYFSVDSFVNKIIADLNKK